MVRFLENLFRNHDFFKLFFLTVFKIELTESCTGLPIHRCVLALCTLRENIPQAFRSGGIQTYDLCHRRAVSYKLDLKSYYTVPNFIEQLKHKNIAPTLSAKQ